jgi:hypothetical protein
MPRNFGSPLLGLIVGLGLLAAMNVPAHASPACVKDPQPLMLQHDFVNWTISAAPGSECIQGLRWSYMRIDDIIILKPPAKGKLVFVGYGFRYFADPDSHAADNFVLVITGKNRHDGGETILDVAVKPAGTVVSELRR